MVHVNKVYNIGALSLKMCFFRERWVALKRAVLGCGPAGLGLLGLGGLLGLLGQQHSLDVGQHAALSDGHSAQQLVELLVVAHRQLEVAGDDAGLLVVAGCVASQLQDLSGQILQHCRQVDGSAGTDSLSIVAFPQQPVDTTHGELQASAGGTGLGLGASLAAGFASSAHDWIAGEVFVDVTVQSRVSSLSYKQPKAWGFW